MDEFCRLCGSEDGIKVNIFEPGSDHVKKIHKVLPITVNEHDPFPKTMCHRCSYKVNEFYEFRTNSIKTQEFFKNKVPWLRDKHPISVDDSQPPMVEVNLNSVNTVSPNEKQIGPPNTTIFIDENLIVIDDDSPPYDDPPATDLFNECDSENQSIVKPPKAKKTKSKSVWDTKKRKTKSKKRSRDNAKNICDNSSDNYANTENDNIVNIEKDPPRIFPVNSFESNSVFAKNEHGSLEKGKLKDDSGEDNRVVPKHILVTVLPQVGNLYTCEICGRSYLKHHLAIQHVCPMRNYIESDSPKEEVNEEANINKSRDLAEMARDFYDCNLCNQVFTRHSQLKSHMKKHSSKANFSNFESSSDESFKPLKRRKKNRTKKKSKPRLLKPANNNFTLNATNECRVSSLDLLETSVARHALLSSDSE